MRRACFMEPRDFLRFGESTIHTYIYIYVYVYTKENGGKLYEITLGQAQLSPFFLRAALSGIMTRTCRTHVRALTIREIATVYFFVCTSRARVQEKESERVESCCCYRNLSGAKAYTYIYESRVNVSPVRASRELRVRNRNAVCVCACCNYSARERKRDAVLKCALGK